MREAFGPLGVAILAAPLIILAIYSAYTAIKKYENTIPEDMRYSVNEILYKERIAPFNRGGVSEEGVVVEFKTIVVKHKIDMISILISIPIYMSFVFLTVWSRFVPKMKVLDGRDNRKSAIYYIVFGIVLIILGCINAVFYPSAGRLTDCQGLSLGSCVQKHTFFTCISIWASVYFLWGGVEFIRLDRQEENR